MTLHSLKVWTEFYGELAEGKNAELRKNDRDYHVGDVLDLKEYDRATSHFSGRHAVREVIHVFDVGRLASELDGWVLLTLREAK